MKGIELLKKRANWHRLGDKAEWKLCRIFLYDEDERKTNTFGIRRAT